jgi:RNA polymerase sigma-70 factor (ECF subfamily)
MGQTATTIMPVATRATQERDEDLGLVSRYLAGHMAAFDELMTRHERPVFRLCFRFVKNREDAMDLTQEVFIKAFEKLTAFRGDARFKTWLYRIAVNHCLNHVKKNSREFAEVDESIGSVKPSFHNKLLEKERRAIVRKLMVKRPPKQTAILELRMDNLSYEEIAGILGRSVSTIKSSVFFALTKPKKMVQQQSAAGAMQSDDIG